MSDQAENAEVNPSPADAQQQPVEQSGRFKELVQEIAIPMAMFNSAVQTMKKISVVMVDLEIDVYKVVAKTKFAGEPIDLDAVKVQAERIEKLWFTMHEAATIAETAVQDIRRSLPEAMTLIMSAVLQSDFNFVQHAARTSVVSLALDRKPPGMLAEVNWSDGGNHLAEAHNAVVEKVNASINTLNDEQRERLDVAKLIGRAVRGQELDPETCIMSQEEIDRLLKENADKVDELTKDVSTRLTEDADDEGRPVK